MKIQPVQNNNMNFQGLHVDKKIYRQLEMGRSKNIFLKNPEIKECADKFEVMIEKGKPIKRKAMEPFSKLLLEFIAGSIGMSGAMSVSLLAGGASIMTPATMFAWGFLGAAVGLAGMTGYIFNREHSNDHEYSLQVGKKIKESMFGKKELLSPLTRKFPIKEYGDIKRISGISELAQQGDEQNFMDIIDNYDVENLFEPKDILKILNDKNIKRNYSNGEVFNYKFYYDNNNTLLTKFLDITPTEENQKDYDKIIEIMKNTENIDYNQVDSNGISVIEKIMNSENLEMLDVVNDFEFNYSRDMDFAYENIKNPKFKRRVKNLNVNFPNIEEAIRIGSEKAIEAVFPEFSSPFCDIAKVLNNSYNKVPLRNYYNVISYINANISHLSNKKRKSYEHFKNQRNKF